MKRPNSAIAYVEKFIKDFHNGNIIVLPEASDVVITFPKKSKLGLTSKKKKTAADMLGWAIAGYQISRDVRPYSDYTLEVAYELLDYIERARTHGIIKDVGLANKVTKLEQENEKLKAENERLKKLNSKLARENKRLHKLLPNAKIGETEVGDIE